MGTAELSPVELPTGPAGVWLLVLSVSSVPPTLALWGEGEDTQVRIVGSLPYP